MMIRKSAQSQTALRMATAVLVLLPLLFGNACRSAQEEAMEQLRSGDPTVREAAIRTLEEGRERSSVAALSDVLRNDPEERLRSRAALALEEIGGPQAIVALLATAGSRDSLRVRFSAANALRNLRDPAAVPGLIALWKREDDREDGAVNLEACGALVAIGQPALPAVMAALRDETANVRYMAAMTAGRIGGPQVRAQLEALLQDPDWLVRVEARNALENLP